MEFISSILELEINSTLAVLLYWLPLLFCGFGYVIRTFNNFKRDKQKMWEPGGYYTPTDTIGTLIGRGVVSIIPVANLLAAVFDVSHDVFSGFFSWLGKLFDTPLVPDNENAKARRKETVTK